MAIPGKYEVGQKTIFSVSNFFEQTKQLSTGRNNRLLEHAMSSLLHNATVNVKPLGLNEKHDYLSNRPPGEDNIEMRKILLCCNVVDIDK